MPEYIVKITDPIHQCDWWISWSSVVDAPTCNGMSRGDFADWYVWRHQSDPMTLGDLQRALDKVERHGVSCYPHYSGTEELIRANRAGDGESELTMEQILDKYCRLPAMEGEEWQMRLKMADITKERDEARQVARTANAIIEEFDVLNDILPGYASEPHECELYGWKCDIEVWRQELDWLKETP